MSLTNWQLTRWQRGVLWTSGLVFSAAGISMGGFGYFLARAWSEMGQDALDRGNPVIHLAHVMPQVALLLGLGLFSLFAAALAVLSLQWFEDEERRHALQRPLAFVAWGARLTLVLAPVLLLLAWIYSVAIPNPLRSSMVPLNVIVTLALMGILICAGPIMGLGWVGLGHWLGWIRRSTEWDTQPGHTGELHRRFASLRRTLVAGAGVLLSLFVWLLPEVMMGLSWGGQMLNIQQLIADQRQVISQIFDLELLLGGLLLLAWRGAGETVCHQLDPQVTPLADHLRDSRAAQPTPQVSAIRV